MDAQKQTVLSETGKRFYTWQTLCTFSGAVVVAGLIWNVLKAVSPGRFESDLTVLVISLLLMVSFAVLTEPPKDAPRTTWRDKGQKAVITIINSLLVYSATVGAFLAVSPPPE